MSMCDKKVKKKKCWVILIYIRLQVIHAIKICCFDEILWIVHCLAQLIKPLFNLWSMFLIHTKEHIKQPLFFIPFTHSSFRKISFIFDHFWFSKGIENDKFTVYMRKIIKNNSENLYLNRKSLSFTDAIVHTKQFKCSTKSKWQQQKKLSLTHTKHSEYGN